MRLLLHIMTQCTQVKKNLSPGCYPALLFIWTASIAQAQRYQSDWDSYVMEVNKKPVSVIVDLGLAKVAPQRERPFIVLVRTPILEPETNGQPSRNENLVLNQMEDSLVNSMEKNTGAIYAGRYTQRGLREYYFYTLDTINYLGAVDRPMKHFPSYKWLSIARIDQKWSNYFEALYPPPIEMERIKNRRVVDDLKSRGDNLKKERKIDHFLYFKTKSARDAFVRDLRVPNIKIEEIPDVGIRGDYPYLLHLSREDSPDYVSIDRVTIPLFELAQKHQGRYDGWETFVVR